jgi:hypothetical protein
MLRPRTIIESNKAETGRICRIIVINEQQGHSRSQTYDIEASTKSPKVFRDSGFLKPCGSAFARHMVFTRASAVSMRTIAFCWD